MVLMRQERLVAYLDESGLGSGPTDLTPAGFIYCAAGLIATETDWKAFSIAWARVLADAGVNPPVLHMRAFKNPKGQFRDWTQERINELVESLIRVIHETGTLGYACVMARGYERDWDQTHSGHIFSDEETVHSSGTLRCIFEIAKKSSGFLGADKRVAFVCGKTGKWDGSVRRLFETARSDMPTEFGDRAWLDSLSFDSPESLPPLQAADLLVYQSRRKWAEYKDENRTSFSRPITQFDQGGRITYCVQDVEHIEPIVRKVVSEPGYREEVERRVAEAKEREERRRARNRAKRNRKTPIQGFGDEDTTR
jgi:hypothetical protein